MTAINGCRAVKLLFLVAVAAVAGSNGEEEKDWWETGNFYQIYPRSFMDSNGDGVGDLNGAAERLEYFKDIGMSGIWFSPIFASPQADFGYDISDYRQIYSEYGTVADLERLMAKANALGIKVILDFVPNHTSDEHEWFQKSVARDPEYEDFYVWHPGKKDANGTRLPPSNWLSSFRFSAWQWNEKRQEYYLHQFSVKQPDLNYRNPKVNEQMKEVLRYWLDRGVSGFRIDAVPFLVEAVNADGSYDDLPVSGKCSDPESLCYLVQTVTQNQPESYDIVFSWRKVLDDYTKEKGDYTRIMMTEAYTTLEYTVEYYGTDKENGSHIPFNFEMINNLNINSTGADYKRVINNYLSKIPDGKVGNWVLGNHDNKRIDRRFGNDRIDLLNILLQTLPGVAVTYYGEEIGMKDVYIPWEKTVDPQACNTDPITFDSVSRDTARTPMQWDSSYNAGFSNASETWLPVGPDYQIENVEAEEEAAKSHLKVFKRLTQLRRSNAFKFGDLKQSLVNDDVYVYKREVSDEMIVVVLNFGSQTYIVAVDQLFDNIPGNLTVVTASITSDFNEGDVVDSSHVVVPSNVGVVLTAEK